MPNWSPTSAVLALGAAAGSRPDPMLEKVLRRWLALGLLAVALLPALRGSSDWLGWWPMWLVAMPGVAWWALHRFRMRLPQQLAARSRRRGGGQARRRYETGRLQARQAA
ncbi:hypothetical protein [Pseudoxanthomonas koreensis]|uniref:hypothetical protein n=1 Tax=Pseudoxanthomonas koreensis TaxID=266061 RepID=UPI001390905E|nr:hypothetical protein [Pseudoxanthomonas koreensis]